MVSQDEKSLGMIVLMAECTASTNVVSPGAAWTVSGARPANKPATAVPHKGRCGPWGRASRPTASVSQRIG
jgi:hypothetical protein